MRSLCYWFAAGVSLASNNSFGADPVCTFYTVGPVSAIVRGSNSSTLFLQSAKKDCYKPFIHNADEPDILFRLRVPQGQPTAIHGSAGMIAGSRWIQMNVEAVPTTGVAEVTAFEIVTDDGTQTLLGQLSLPLVDIGSDIQLRATYSDPVLNAIVSNSPVGDAGLALMALTTPSGVDDTQSILNTAQFRAPVRVQEVSDNAYAWRVSAQSWSGNVTFRLCDRPPIGAACIVGRVGNISFVARNAEPGPLRALLELTAVDAKTEFTKWASLLSVSVILAQGARNESIPLPISNALSVKCDNAEHDARNGGIIAIDEEMLTTQRCHVVFTADHLAARVYSAIRLYGRQVLYVAVSRSGVASPSPAQWLLDPASPQDFAITLPDGFQSGSGPYRVEVRIAVASQQITYRSGTIRPGTTFSEVLSPEYIFFTSLRPRGPFSLPGSKRVFITIPINVTGLRFPANVRDLQRSTDNVGVQAIPLEVGVLLGLEPWNYAEGRTGWSLPVRLLTGFNLIDLRHASFSPAFLFGGSVTTSLIESPTQFGASVALGAFLEVDTRNSSSHFLLTLGLNLFSLLGATKG